MDSSQVGSVGGVQKLEAQQREFREEQSLSQRCVLSTEQARCNCVVEKGTKIHD